MYPDTSPTPAEVDALFRRQREGDRLGVRIHEAAACGACFFAGWPTSFVEFGPLALWIVAAVRMTGRWRILGPLYWDAVSRWVVALVCWMFLSLAWSAARAEGVEGNAWLDDVAPLRFAPFIVALYPVLERRGLLVACVLAGVACGQVSQVVGVIGERAGIAWMHWHRMPGRESGWWDPVVGGSVLCAGLAMWLGPAVMGARGRHRVIGAVGAAATLVCVIATGTRGAWIGAGLVLVVVAGLAVARTRRRGRAMVVAGVIGVACIAGAVGAWTVAGQETRDRLDAGVREVRAVFEGGEYRSDTGMRLAMWRWAAIETRAHPLIGVGASGFQPWADQRLRSADAAELPPRPAAHAHSWALHALATLGIIGLAIMGGFVVSAIVFGLRVPGARAWENGWHAAPALGLIGLACAGLFDTIHLNQQTANLLFILVALCVPKRPTPLDSLPSKSRTLEDAAEAADAG